MAATRLSDFAPPIDTEDQLGVEGKWVLLTFGLLSPDKGIEHVIDALPTILARYPETVYIRHNPSYRRWWDRDRFGLSAWHGSAPLYALPHLTGYDLALDQLKRFRQWEGLTPGHPESHLSTGDEASTGPLSQGIGNALGMAIVEAHLAARDNRPGHEIFGHFTYVLATGRSGWSVAAGATLGVISTSLSHMVKAAQKALGTREVSPC